MLCTGAEYYNLLGVAQILQGRVNEGREHVTHAAQLGGSTMPYLRENARLVTQPTGPGGAIEISKLRVLLTHHALEKQPDRYLPEEKHLYA